MATFSIEIFSDHPSVDYLRSCSMRKVDWIEIARQYEIAVNCSDRKSQIKNAVLNKLWADEILPDEALELCDEQSDFAVKQLELNYAREEKQKEREEKQKEREEKQKEREFQMQREEKEREFQLQMLELKLKYKQENVDSESYSGEVTNSAPFDISKVVRLVPVFDELDPDEFFSLFEKLATSLNWPKTLWSIILQSALKGKGRSAFLSLSLTDSKTYDLVKETVLKAYELTSEFYLNKFRMYKKLENESYVEYAHIVTKLHEKWYTASNVDSLEEYKELIILEQFLKGIPTDVRYYLNEREVKTVQRAATLAENFSLINVQKKKVHPKNAPEDTKGESKNSSNSSRVGNSKNKDITCFKCGGQGHISRYCKNSQQAKPNKNASSMATVTSNFQETNHCRDETTDEASNSFEPFIFTGYISLSSGDKKKVPVRIVRDTASSHSLVLRSSFPRIYEALTGERVVLSGVHIADSVPLCSIFLDCGLVSKIISVGVIDKLPIEGVDFVMGNDLAGRRIVPDPILVDKPLLESPTAELELTQPNLFPVCILDSCRLGKGSGSTDECGLEANGSISLCEESRGGSHESGNLEELIDVDVHDLKDVAKVHSIGNTPEGELRVSFLEDDSEEMFRDLNKLFESEDNGSSCLVGCVLATSLEKVTTSELVKLQKKDPELQPYYELVVSNDSLSAERSCFYMHGEVLMRKYKSLDTPASAVWDVKHQIVVPQPMRRDMIQMTHESMYAHLGIKKTVTSLQKYFYWKSIWRDVRDYCKCCEVCQKAGKPNQVIKPVPLNPIPVVSEPFSKVIIDCVGPLPKTKKQNQYLLTVMCSSIRYPDAFPLRNIKAKTLIPCLIKVFTQYGIPRVIQSDQGTNFTSNLFRDAMVAMGVIQQFSSVYHPQTQGALERFHQTLKECLMKYCLDNGKDWDEGLPFILFALRNAKQESLSYSPAELLYGRELRGPLRYLYECWLDDEVNKLPVTVYAKNLNEKLKSAMHFAHKNLSSAQKSMKDHFDRRSENRIFSPGDKVYMLTPIRKSLEARFEGPYTVLRRDKDNYVVSTPDKRSKEKLVHANLLKMCKTQANGQVLISIKETVEEEESFKVKEPSVRLNNSNVFQNLYKKLINLNCSQAQEIQKVLSKFSDLCGDVPTVTPMVECKLNLKPGTEPRSQPPYRTSPQKREVMRKEVDFLLDNGFAEEASSPWASPCILVAKPDNSYRMCTDFRHLNQVTVPDSYPLPRVDDLIDEVGKSSYITKIDLLKGYYQIPLAQESRDLTAFVTPDGLYRYCVMPFGLQTAPAVFQRLMNKVIRGLKHVKVYLDDLVVFTNSWEEHIQVLNELFSRLRRANLTVNLAKSEFGHGRIQYLGYMIGSGTIAPVDAKVESIKNLAVPTTRKGVQKFLGTVGYYRRFCPNFSQVAAPLTDLTSSKKKFVWTEGGQEAFDKIKGMLTCKPVLKSPNFNEQIHLQVDASETGAGAVLLQKGIDDLLHPVAFMSCKFKPYQMHYSTIEKEALSLLLALEKFDVYVSGSSHPVVVYVDHQPLKFLHRMKLKNARLTRWWLSLQSYNLDIQHIKGKYNVMADLLSRDGMM